MVTEMLVALSAIIAACALEPGQYFAINTPADPPTVAVHEAVIARVNAAGFAVTLPEMQQLAAEMAMQGSIFVVSINATWLS
jgi:carbon starvation protein